MGCCNSAADQPNLAVSTRSPPKFTDIGRVEGFRSPELFPRGCLGERLGAGAYAKVYAVHRSATLFPHSPLAQGPLAAKVIHFNARNSEVGQTPQVRYERALREADVWQRICKQPHGGIVALVETFLDQNSVVFVMERCEVTLAKYLGKCPKLDECLVAGLLKQMLQSLQHIHGCDVIHRDVKPDNFLLGANSVLKISDFGLAVTSDNIWEKGNRYHPITNPNAAPMVAGTAPFMSPEMLSKVVYSMQTDIWSVGCIAYAMLLGQFVYMPKEMNTHSMKNAIRSGKPEPQFQPGPDSLFPNLPKGSYNGPSKEAQAFMVSVLARDAADRPTSAEALEHPYLTRSLSDEDVMNLPCLNCMFRRAMRCGVFEMVRSASPPARPSGSSNSRSPSHDGFSGSRRLSSESNKGSRKPWVTADTTASATTASMSALSTPNDSSTD